MELTRENLNKYIMLLFTQLYISVYTYYSENLCGQSLRDSSNGNESYTKELLLLPFK